MLESEAQFHKINHQDMIEHARQLNFFRHFGSIAIVSGRFGNMGDQHHFQNLFLHFRNKYRINETANFAKFTIQRFTFHGTDLATLQLQMQLIIIDAACYYRPGICTVPTSFAASFTASCWLSTGEVSAGCNSVIWTFYFHVCLYIVGHIKRATLL